MKSLNYKELSLLASDLDKKLRGNHISNINVITSSDIIFSFSFYRQEKLLISINHAAPFVSLIDNSFNVTGLLSRLSDDLRKYVKDSVIESISTLDKERILKITLGKSDEFYERQYFELYIELIPTRSNLIMLDKDKKIVFASFYTSLDAKRAIIKGMEYVPLISNNPNDKEYEVNLDKFNNDVNLYISELSTRRLKEKYHKLILNIKSRIKKSKNKEEALEKEIEQAKKDLIYQEYGQMVLAYIYDKDELDKYVNENNIPYDINLSPSDNASKMFKKYKKAKQTIIKANEQIDINRDALKELEEDYALLDDGDESIYLVLSNKYLTTPIPKQEINKIMPYYVTIDGTKIGFGRNASQNDLLTFKKGKPEHYFLHLENTHANHVVILKNNPTDKDKENAAELCLALLNKEAGNIQIAQIKDIKKGHVPGLVILNKYTVIKINNVSQKVKNSLEKAKRISF